MAACIRNPWTGFGGLNHFMLPEGSAADGITGETANRFGNFAMPALVNAVLASGCERADLEVKLFGGGHDRLDSNVGRQNSEFALRFFREAGIPVSSVDIGGATGEELNTRQAMEL